MSSFDLRRRPRAARPARVAASALLALACLGSASAAAAGAALPRAALTLVAPADAQPCSQYLLSRFTGSEQSCVVPGGVSRVEIIAVGGRGGSAAPGCDGFPAAGGSGGWGDEVVSPSVAVKPGEQLFVEVGGAGGDAAAPCGVAGRGAAGRGGWNGGGNGVLSPTGQGSAGGGGASDVRTVSCAAVCAQAAGFGT